MSDLPRITVEVQGLDDREFVVVPVKGMEPIWVDCRRCEACGSEDGDLFDADAEWCYGHCDCADDHDEDFQCRGTYASGRVLVGLMATRPCEACGGEGGFWTAGTEGEGPLPSASRVVCPSCGGRGSIPTAETRDWCETHDYPVQQYGGRTFCFGEDEDDLPCEWVRVVVMPWGNE